MPRRLVLSVLMVLLAAGCSASDEPPGARQGATDRAADLDALTEMLLVHPDPPDVTVGVEDLRARAAELTDAQWLVELMRLTAGRDRDGHTGVFPLAQPGLEVWPVQLYGFDDGWRVVAAQPPYEDLVGGEVTSIGGAPVQEAVDLVAPIVPRDNEMTVRARAAQYLVVPEVLAGLGLEPSLAVDGRTVTPQPVSAASYAQWSGSFDPGVVPRLPPVPQVDLSVSVDGGAVVVGYHRVTGSSGELLITDVADQVRAAVAQGRADRVVLDLRRNSGGENGSYPPLLDALQEVEAQRPGSVRLLIGRTTFSAATNLVAELLATTGAVTVGETMGGAPNMWGDARPRRLPGSGTTVHVASRLWELGGKDLRPAISPVIAVPVTAADWAAGRDRALELALSR